MIWKIKETSLKVKLLILFFFFIFIFSFFRFEIAAVNAWILSKTDDIPLPVYEIGEKHEYVISKKEEKGKEKRKADTLNSIRKMADTLSQDSNFYDIFARLRKLGPAFNSKNSYLIARIYDKIVWLAPNVSDKAKAYIALERIYKEQGNYSKLLDTYRKLEKEYPDFPVVIDNYLKLTSLYLSRRDYKRAEMYLKILEERVKDKDKKVIVDKYRAILDREYPKKEVK